MQKFFIFSALPFNYLIYPSLLFTVKCVTIFVCIRPDPELYVGFEIMDKRLTASTGPCKQNEETSEHHCLKGTVMVRFSGDPCTDILLGFHRIFHRIFKINK